MNCYSRQKRLRIAAYGEQRPSNEKLVIGTLKILSIGA
jgi:hypothetical protein